MALLTPIDMEALQQVRIAIFPDQLVPGDNDLGDVDRSGGYILDSNNLQFPPLITKDSKNAVWEEHQTASYEPFKVYKYSQSRAIALKFQWVVGGNFPPQRIHQIISNVKAYFYHIAAGQINSNSQKYPAVWIDKFYNIITRRTTWRMMDIDVKYSEELVKVNQVFYPLHVTLTMNLEASTRLASSRTDPSTELYPIDVLAKRPHLSWY